MLTATLIIVGVLSVAAASARAHSKKAKVDASSGTGSGSLAAAIMAANAGTVDEIEIRTHVTLTEALPQYTGSAALKVYGECDEDDDDGDDKRKRLIDDADVVDDSELGYVTPEANDDDDHVCKITVAGDFDAFDIASSGSIKFKDLKFDMGPQGDAAIVIVTGDLVATQKYEAEFNNVHVDGGDADAIAIDVGDSQGQLNGHIHIKASGLKLTDCGDQCLFVIIDSAAALLIDIENSKFDDSPSDAIVINDRRIGATTMNFDNIKIANSGDTGIRLRSGAGGAVRAGETTYININRLSTMNTRAAAMRYASDAEGVFTITNSVLDTSTEGSGLQFNTASLTTVNVTNAIIRNMNDFGLVVNEAATELVLNNVEFATMGNNAVFVGDENGVDVTVNVNATNVSITNVGQSGIEGEGRVTMNINGVYMDDVADNGVNIGDTVDGFSATLNIAGEGLVVKNADIAIRIDSVNDDKATINGYALTSFSDITTAFLEVPDVDIFP